MVIIQFCSVMHLDGIKYMQMGVMPMTGWFIQAMSTLNFG